jgi:hypothetical protein
MGRIAIALRLWIYFLGGASFTSVAGQHTEATCNITGLQWVYLSVRLLIRTHSFLFDVELQLSGPESVPCGCVLVKSMLR